MGPGKAKFGQILKNRPKLVLPGPVKTPKHKIPKVPSQFCVTVCELRNIPLDIFGAIFDMCEDK